MSPRKMKDGEFGDRRSRERLFSDVELYRKLGKTAEKAIRFGEAVIETRDYQTEVWKVLREVRENGEDSALIHLATGLGKTTVGVVDSLDFAVDFHRKHGRLPKIMFAVHQNEILEQAAERFEEFAPSLSQGNYADGEKNTSADVTFATMQSLSQNLSELDKDEFDYIIYDEAHHSQAETFSNVINHFKPSFKLALTATPDRMDGEDIRDLFGEEKYSKPLHEAMLEGYLADVDYHIVFDEAVKRAMENGFNLSTLKEIQELMSNESRNDEIAMQILEEMEKIGLENAKTIVFCQDVDQADQMAELLDGKAYHSNIPKNQREEILREFRSNGLQVIVVRDMFNEGIDIPDARLAVFLRSTSSRTIFEQQIGRILRKNEGKDVASILDFVANIERLSQITELRDKIKDELKKREGGDGEGGVFDSWDIHTDHTDFDFDRLSVEFLKKISAIKERDEKVNPKSMHEAKILWREIFGDKKPTYSLIDRAAREGIYCNYKYLNYLKDKEGIKDNISGVNLLKKELGFNEDRPEPESIEDAAFIWRNEFGMLKPTFTNINKASQEKRFCSGTFLNKIGGIYKLRDALEKLND